MPFPQGDAGTRAWDRWQQAASHALRCCPEAGHGANAGNTTFKIFASRDVLGPSMVKIARVPVVPGNPAEYVAGRGPIEGHDLFVVTVTAVALRPAWSEVLAGIAWPTIPQLSGEGLQWTVALMGGVGGTVTVLCYGYWICEEGRAGAEHLRTCRIDLATGYLMTAVFGLSMVIIGSRIGAVEGGGARLVVQVAERLESVGAGRGGAAC